MERRFFVVLGLGGGGHALGELPDHVVLASFEEQHRVAHVLGVLLRGYLARARRRAALDLVQQAWARAVLEHGVLASAQTKNALQKLDAFAHRISMGERAEVAVASGF